MSFLHFLQHDPSGATQAARPSWDAGTADPETVRRIAGRLSELDPQRAAFLAGVGYCLARVVAADLAVTDAERAEMVNQVEAFAGVPAQEAQLIVDLAVHEAMAGAGTDDFYVTQRVRALATPEQLEALLHCLFAVAAPGDETISFEENRAIREISDELGFTMAELNAVRRTFADKMAVVRMAQAAGTSSAAAEDTITAAGRDPA
ncbi:MAG TPA: TerB family tellurite resistance protein [Candidatus Baltobacteraceae bacterium]|nr:TerB family tellurite resistance protein [Candidatus Baltobacteraceae bacterium]